MIVYTVIGGLKAVVNTDIVQMIFVIVTFIAVFIAVQIGLKGIDPAQNLLSETAQSSKSVPWFAWLLMPLLFMFIEQDMGQRCFAARTPKTVTVAGIISAIALMVFSLFAIYLGILAKNMGLNIPESKGVLMTAVSSFSNPVVSTIFAGAFLMVILSTADSVLCSIASNLAFDFSFFKKNNKVFMAQTITFFVGFSAMLCSYLFKNIVPLFIQAYELSVSVLFISIVMAVLSKRPSIKAAICSMVLGTVSFIGFRIFTIDFPREVITIGLSCVGFWAVQLLENRKRRTSRAAL